MLRVKAGRGKSTHEVFDFGGDDGQDPPGPFNWGC